MGTEIPLDITALLGESGQAYAANNNRAARKLLVRAKKLALKKYRDNWLAASMVSFHLAQVLINDRSSTKAASLLLTIVNRLERRLESLAAINLARVQLMLAGVFRLQGKKHRSVTAAVEA